MSPSGQTRKSVTVTSMSAFGGRAEVDFGWLDFQFYPDSDIGVYLSEYEVTASWARNTLTASCASVSSGTGNSQRRWCMLGCRRAAECRMWATSRPPATRNRLPLFPRKQTFSWPSLTSGCDPNRSFRQANLNRHVPQSNGSLSEQMTAIEKWPTMLRKAPGCLH